MSAFGIVYRMYEFVGIWCRSCVSHYRARGQLECREVEGYVMFGVE